MGDFPRIELFTPREKRALAVFSVALLAILLGAVIYTRPAVTHPPTVATSTPRPTPTPAAYVNVTATAPDTAYIQTFASIYSNERPLGSYRTDNGGRSWQSFQTPRGDGCPFGLVPGPTKDDVLMVACNGGGAWISHDGGRRWRYQGWWDLEIFSDDGRFGSDYSDSVWKLAPHKLAATAMDRFPRLWVT